MNFRFLVVYKMLSNFAYQLIIIHAYKFKMSYIYNMYVADEFLNKIGAKRSWETLNLQNPIQVENNKKYKRKEGQESLSQTEARPWRTK